MADSNTAGQERTPNTVGVREASSRGEGSTPFSGDDLVGAVRALRTHWRTASLAAGWPFPGDWALPEVDQVCVAASLDEDLLGSLADLGRARAAAGAGLAETLSDLAALHAVLDADDQPADGLIGADPDALPSRLLRGASIAWAEVALRQATNPEVSDGLTGLGTSAYLRTRLREIYAECEVRGIPVEHEYALLVVAVDMSGSTSWSRMAAVVLLADVLRTVFDGGQSISALGPSVLVALSRRDAGLIERTAIVRESAADRLLVDTHLHQHCHPRIWIERLPPNHRAACRLLAQLSHG